MKIKEFATILSKEDAETARNLYKVESIKFPDLYDDAYCNIHTVNGVFKVEFGFETERHSGEPRTWKHPGESAWTEIILNVTKIAKYDDEIADGETTLEPIKEKSPLWMILWGELEMKLHNQINDY